MAVVFLGVADADGKHQCRPATEEEMHRPELIWWAVVGAGVVTTLLLWIYDQYLRRETSTSV